MWRKATLISAVAFVATVCAPQSALADTFGTIVRANRVQVADTSAVPGAHTVGGFFRGASTSTLRAGNVATKDALEITVLMPDGGHLQVVQDAAPGFTVGAVVAVKDVGGHQVVELR